MKHAEQLEEDVVAMLVQASMRLKVAVSAIDKARKENRLPPTLEAQQSRIEDALAKVKVAAKAIILEEVPERA